MSIALSIAGCATLPKKPAVTQPWEQHRAELQQRAQYALKGRVAVAVAAGQEGFSARLRWQQQGVQSHVALDGPFGAGGVQMDWDGTALRVRNARGQQLDSDAAREELLGKLGFEPPFESLRYWLLGAPDPATPADEVADGQQRLASLRQGGWQIDYGAYLAVQGQWLPQRLTLHREGVRVRVLIEQWGGS